MERKKSQADAKQVVTEGWVEEAMNVKHDVTCKTLPHRITYLQLFPVAGEIIHLGLETIISPPRTSRQLCISTRELTLTTFHHGERLYPRT